jgi:hypothetical protein
MAANLEVRLLFGKTGKSNRSCWTSDSCLMQLATRTRGLYQFRRCRILECYGQIEQLQPRGRRLCVHGSCRLLPTAAICLHSTLELISTPGAPRWTRSAPHKACRHSRQAWQGSAALPRAACRFPCPPPLPLPVPSSLALPSLPSTPHGPALPHSCTPPRQATDKHSAQHWTQHPAPALTCVEGPESVCLVHWVLSGLAR